MKRTPPKNGCYASRVVFKINYSYGVVWVRFIGTHAEYDKVDAVKI
ncbi:MAG: type II toxin-antitoxin system HigB family toxin [Adhaeribacter sp.]